MPGEPGDTHTNSMRRTALRLPGGWRCWLAGFLLAACLLGGELAPPPPARASQSPAAYLSSALAWLQANEVRTGIDWTAIRQHAASLAHGARTLPDTYPALRYAIDQLGDRFAFVDPGNQPNLDSGYSALYPDGTVVRIETGGPAAHAGLHLGDRILLLNGVAPKHGQGSDLVDPGAASRQRLIVRRAGRTLALSITLIRTGSAASPPPVPTGRRIAEDGHALGYEDITPTDGDTPYATQAQQLLRDVDRQPACGWIIDLRQTTSGDLWSYLAATGPILGQGTVGGFLYRDGRGQPWAYENGQVLWNGHVRPEGQVNGPVYTLKRPLPPVALLLDSTTEAAGEATAVAFAGRPEVRTFGEPTYGTPVFQTYMAMSDGTVLGVSGAYSYDRTGRVYRGSIVPEVRVATDWANLGTSADPVVQAAAGWLRNQPTCKG